MGHWGELVSFYMYRTDEIRTFPETFDLSEEDCEAIAHGNAERLFHLS